jgi:dipeptidyl-peptidase-4
MHISIFRKNTISQWFLMAITLLLCAGILPAQTKKAITLEDVWMRPIWPAATVTGINWMKDGKFYTSLSDNKIIQYDIRTGQEVAVIMDGNTLRVPGSGERINIDDYQFSADESRILIATETEAIYRRSSKSRYFIYDRSTQKLSPLSTLGKQSYATFSPDGKHVAYFRANNLFLVTLSDMKEVAITTTGFVNKIIHGACDWVYEEEFEFAQAFFWSPDAAAIAYYTFDESEVPEFNMQKWGGLYPTDYRFKYPKAGEKNSKVDISVYTLADKRTITFPLNSERDQYIPRVMWTKDPNLLSVRRMNRLQNHLEILHCNVKTATVTLVLEEKSNTYIDINDDLTYLNNGKSFIHASEKDGYKHLYLYDMNGKLIQAITSGKWEVDDFLGYNEKKNEVYFTSTEASPIERQLYVVSLKNKAKTRLSKEKGTHKINFNTDFTYYIDQYSAADTPPVTTLFEGNGKPVKVLENNSNLKNRLASYKIQPKEFFTFTTSENVELHGFIIKPEGFDAGKKYPVFMHCYGGPGHQTVLDIWGGPDFFWFQTIVEKGYVVVAVDGRGTGGKGADFKKATYAQLGKLEVTDQIEAAKYLINKGIAEPGRIGIFGWSFGGYLTSLCLTLGAEYFNLGIAVAPVTNWRYYDTIYTERFLKTPQENPSGYDDYSPVTHAAKLKGKYLLVHGTGDDNVHFQNAVAMQDALIKANKQFNSFFYPNRNHGIYGGNTRYHLYTMMSDFIFKNL